MSAEIKSEKNPDMVTIEVDGQPIEIRKNAMIIEATDKVGIDIPRFCYHKKLSIAANCRMCLVDVEKAPKPLPACATPVADGMKVFTESRRARDAQQGVMEFLLINHPLDCPICDQGGECELQDLAMGYGRSVSRFTERKRVVKDENLGSLVSTDMTRCIHCTRCVRFLEEVAGTNELGGMGRGENTRISTFIGRNVDSEVSGNIIDLCPVGALTNKPYRFSARAWELQARAGVSSHDCLNSSIWYHVRRGQIMRAVPRDNEVINETWLADRDRYAHFGLEHQQRATQPLVKQNSSWQAASWNDALQTVASKLEGLQANQLGVLASPNSSCEDHFVLSQLVKSLGGSMDYRLRCADASLDGVAHSSMPLSALEQTNAALIVGSKLRHEQPLLAIRLRKAWRENGAAISSINAVKYQWHFQPEQQVVVPPSEWLQQLAGIASAALKQGKNSTLEGELSSLVTAAEVTAAHEAIAKQLLEADNAVLVAGQQILHQHNAAQLLALMQSLAEMTGAELVVLSDAANGRGALQMQQAAGVNRLPIAELAGQRVIWLHDFDPLLDVLDPAAIKQACEQAELVVISSSFVTDSMRELADVILPTTALAESNSSVLNLNGVRQTVVPAGKPKGDAKALWKLIRVIANLLPNATEGGMNWDTEADINSAVQDLLDEAATEFAPKYQWQAVSTPTLPKGALPRLAEIPMFATDLLTRHSAPLQQSNHHIEQGVITMHPETASAQGLSAGQHVHIQSVGQDEMVEAAVSLNDDLAQGMVSLPMPAQLSAQLGSAAAPLVVSLFGAAKDKGVEA